MIALKLLNRLALGVILAACLVAPSVPQTLTTTGAFVTLTGAQILAQKQFTGSSETVNALGAAGGTRTVNYALGNVVTATASTSTNTFAVTNPPTSGVAGSWTLILTNGGSQTVVWMTTTKWAGGAAPTLTAAGVDILTFLTVDGGTTWYGFAAALNAS